MGNTGQGETGAQGEKDKVVQVVLSSMRTV